MTFNQYKREENENKKFVEDSDGNTAVRVKISDGINLTEGSDFIVKDHRGFTIFRIEEETGNVYIKGEWVKI